MSSSAESVPALSLGVRALSPAANARLALVGDLASKGSALAVAVVAARLLSTSQFALLGVCLALVTVLSTALDAGVSILVVREGARDAGRRGAVLRASARARVPFVVVVSTASVAYGIERGRSLEVVAVVAAALVGAASLSLLAVLRAAQNLAFEAGQKLAAGGLSLALATALILLSPTAAAALAGLALGPALVLPFAVARARLAAPRGPRLEALPTLAAAAPLGAMALATLVYYRAPTILLGHVGPASETAAYTVASTIGFGLLAVPNAITTGLLSRLSAIADAEERRTVCRRALGWTCTLGLALAASVAAVAPRLLDTVFGERYDAAVGPLLVLLASGVLIGASGVLGSLLVASRRTGVLVAQVGVSVVVNLVASAALIPRYGAMGAALATLATEVVAIAWLAAAVRPAPARSVVPGLRIGTSTLRAGVLATLGGLLALDMWALRTSYGLRVISDAPSYLAIVRDMAIRPFEPISAFLRTPLVEESHATPYTQGLASLWKLVARPDAAGRPLPDPVALGRFLALCGVLVFALTMLAFFVWVRRHAGTREAWIALPVLLVLFGPAHVIWAGDLSFHGFLYGAYFPQTLALALLLVTLIATDGRPRVRRYVGGTLAATATLVLHPFTGILLAVLLAARGSWLAFARRTGWHVGGSCLFVAFLLGQLWPSYSLERALGEAGVPGQWLIGACALAPVVARALPQRLPLAAAIVVPLRALASRRLELPLAAAGLAIVLALAAWESWLVRQPSHDPLIHSNHLSLYWVEDRWRWPLMLAAGIVGLQGLARLALDRLPLPAFWLGSCFGIGAAGALGLSIPVWWRFLLFCQLPLALGVAVWLEGSRRGWARRFVFATFAFTAVFKVVTLLALPTAVTYFGTPLQESYRLGQIVPRAPGVVASDPFTSYLVPAATGHRVLVVTKAHVSSQAELDDAAAGYRLLHRFYMGRDWWQAAQQMYRQGVRYVLIEKSTSLRAPDLETFSTGPTPLVRTARDRRLLGTYYYRNNRVGRIVYDHAPYTLYRLEPRRLFE